MKKFLLCASVLASVASVASAGPTAPNAVPYPNGISFAEFLAVNGCELIDKGGYSNLRGPDGGACLAIVDWSRSGGGYLKDGDGNPATFDPEWVGSDY